MNAVGEMSEAAPATASESGRKLPLVALVAMLVVVLDQLTKSWIAQSFRVHEAITIIPGFFDLVHARNTGAAFSMLADAPAAFRIPFFVVVSTVAALALLGFIRSTPASARGSLVACSLVLGGALGNLIDRVAHGFVIDFVDLYVGDYHWPAFNVADSCITVGVAVLLLQSIRSSDA